eukprot:9148287-Alexandrium_andersonii.AAC.1
MVAWGRVGRVLRAAAQGAFLVAPYTVSRVTCVVLSACATVAFPGADTTLNSHGRVLRAAVQTLAL